MLLAKPKPLKIVRIPYFSYRMRSAAQPFNLPAITENILPAVSQHVNPWYSGLGSVSITGTTVAIGILAVIGLYYLTK